MERLIAALKSAGELVFLLVVAPFLLPLAWLVFCLYDWVERLQKQPVLPDDEPAATRGASS